MSQQHILAIDQGTSGTKTVIFDSNGRIAAKATCPLKSCYPQPGFVEQEPEEIPVLPMKKDIFTDYFGILWEPYYLDTGGKLVAAF